MCNENFTMPTDPQHWLKMPSHCTSRLGQEEGYSQLVHECLPQEQTLP